MNCVLERQVPLAEEAEAAAVAAEAAEAQQLPALLQIEVPGKQVDGWQLAAAAAAEVGEEPRARARARARTPGLHQRLLL
jgi:hypothetical protein